jgi:hypothetical protein
LSRPMFVGRAAALGASRPLSDASVKVGLPKR